MAIPPVGTIREALHQALAQWRHWDCPTPLQAAPEVERALGGGESNASFLVSAGQQFVVRIDAVRAQAHGINRQAEWRVLGVAHQRGIAPRPCYFNPELGALVCTYLPPDEPAPDNAAITANLLRRIHALPRVHQRLNLDERLLRYQRGLEHDRDAISAGLARLRPAIEALLAVVERDTSEPVLCHNDLLRANRLCSGGNLYAIDWEYASMARPLYDLAVVIHGDDLRNPEATELTRHFLGRPAEAAENSLLLAYGCLYRYLELLWYRAVENAAQRTNDAVTRATGSRGGHGHREQRLADLEALVASALR